MITVKNLSKSFGKNVVLQDLSFSVTEGERVLISAPSGAGKTTLFRILAGLESADAGKISGCSREQISYLFQEPRLFPHLTVLENVTYVHPDPKAAEEQGTVLLKRLGLSDALNRHPAELSGGMKQRVALARALCWDRPILLLDEPFTALDPELKSSVRALVAEACQGRTLLLVSHDPEDGKSLTQRTVYL